MVIPDGHPLRVPSLFRVGSAHAQWSGAGRICQEISFGQKNMPFFEDFFWYRLQKWLINI